MIRSLLAAFAMLALAGCCGGGGGSRQQRLAEWHFESDCTTDLCGFTAQAGGATRVTALTSGEHALQLAPGTVLQQNFSVPITNGSTIVVSAAARCDSGTTISVQVTVTDTLGTVRPDGGLADAGFSNGQRVPVSESTTLNATTSWTQLSGDLLPSSTAPTNVVMQVASQIQISLTGSGGCTIDDIVLTSSNANGFFCG